MATNELTTSTLNADAIELALLSIVNHRAYGNDRDADKLLLLLLEYASAKTVGKQNKAWDDFTALADL